MTYGRDPQSYSVAIHEAAHAVVAVTLNRAVQYVTIEPGDEGDSVGHCALRPHTDEWFERFAERCQYAVGGFFDARTRRAGETEIMISLAGLVAQREYLGLDELAGAGSVEVDAEQRLAVAERHGIEIERLIVGGDLQTAARFVDLMTGGVEEVASAYFAYLEARTRTLLHHPFVEHQVRAVADALVECATLRGTEVRSVMNAAAKALLTDRRSIFNAVEV